MSSMMNTATGCMERSASTNLDVETWDGVGLIRGAGDASEGTDYKLLAPDFVTDADEVVVKEEDGISVIVGYTKTVSADDVLSPVEAEVAAIERAEVDDLEEQLDALALKLVAAKQGLLPLEVFPELVWLKIFDKLSNADMLSCFQSCRDFREWLKEKRIFFMFSDVLTILKEQEHLKPKDFLNCRQVCRRWEEALDQQNQTQSFLQFHPHEHHSKLRSILTKEFNSTSSILKFLKSMWSHPKNPFIGRHLTFNDTKSHGNPKNHEAYWKAVWMLLEKFGSGLWAAVFLMHDSESLPVEMNIRRCLERMPNLRKVVLRVYTAWILQKCYKPPIERMRTYFETNSFPKLPYLETVALAHGNLGHPIILSKILGSARENEIKRFYFGQFSQLDFEQLESFPNMQNVETLAIPLKPQDLERLCDLSFPLKSIRLYVQFPVLDGGLTDFESLFRKLEKFGATLMEVEVSISNGIIEAPFGSVYQVNLPKLESLEITGYRGYPDPLLLLKRLKTLKVDFHQGYSRRKDGSTASTYFFVQRVSTLWDLPLLTKVVIKGMYCDGNFNQKYSRNVAGEMIMSGNQYAENLPVPACTSESDDDDDDGGDN